MKSQGHWSRKRDWRIRRPQEREGRSRRWQEGPDGGGRESEDPATGSLMQGFTGLAKDLGLSPKSHGKSLQGLEWGLTIYI